MTASFPRREALAPAALTALDRLGTRAWIGEFYLAGSAGLALHLAPRRDPVRDLDFMTATNRLAGPERRDLLSDLKAMDPSTTVETARDGFLYARLEGGGAARFFHYPYPLIETEEETAGVLVASLADLGLMKLAAIVSRGARRDYADLYAIARSIPVERLFELAPDKFGHVGDFTLQALKSLTDWSELEGEPMPEFADGLDWDRLSSWLVETAGRLGRAHVGLA